MPRPELEKLAAALATLATVAVSTLVVLGVVLKMEPDGDSSGLPETNAGEVVRAKKRRKG
jgi:hypothetical protein